MRSVYILCAGLVAAALALGTAARSARPATPAAVLCPYLDIEARVVCLLSAAAELRRIDAEITRRQQRGI